MAIIKRIYQLSDIHIPTYQKNFFLKMCLGIRKKIKKEKNVAKFTLVPKKE